MVDVAKRHSLQIYSISLPQLPVVDLNLSLERLAHSTGKIDRWIHRYIQGAPKKVYDVMYRKSV